MSQVSTEVRDNPHCYICNSRVGVSTRNSVQIFNKQINTHSERPMHVIIGKVLGKELTETAVHSLLICKKCFKLFSEYDELETRLSEIKIEVVYNYRRTVVKYKGDADLKDDVEPIYVLKKLDEIKNEPGDDLKDAKHDKNQDNIKKSNSSEQRKAAHSSSGNKALNIVESQKQMEDIEMQLEKMYEETEDKTKTNEMTAQEEEIMEVETIEQIESYTDNVPQISIPEDDSRSFEGLIEEDDEPVDAGAIDNSDDSDYQPPVVLEVIQNGDDKQNGDDNTAALLEAAALAEQHEDGTLMFNVKLEPGVTYEDLKQAVRKKSGHKKLLRAKMEEYTDPIVSRDGAIYTCLVCEAVSTEENGGEATGERVLGDAKAMMEHVKQAHDLRVYICDLCGDDFRKRNELNAHLDEHVAAEDGDFQCETCNRIFSNLRLFRIHKRMHYPQNKLWTCESCGKRYSSRNLLEEHINTHTGYRPYVCNVCSKDFASKYTYRAHMKTHEVRPRPFQCSQCDKSFLSQQNLTQHERTHTGIKDHVCNLCGKAFGSTHNLEVHSIVHTGYKPFICRTCGKAFARKAEIRDHERTHTGERPYQCEFCGATFSQRSNLQSHKRATHYDDKRYKCHECGKGFKRRRLLDYHMKAVHTGERPFKCTVCNATFVYPEHFKKHRRIHTGEKPFLCEVCGKAFNSRDNRNAHRFVHSDKKPYECLVCGMGFMRKPLLYAHMEAQGHLNDTIVVNQPRLTTDDDQVVTFNIDGELEVVDGQGIEEDTKMYITDHMIVHESEDGTLIIPEQEGTEGKVGRLIIDGQEVRYAENADDEVEITTGEITTAEHILQAAASGAQGRDEYEEVITDGLVNEHNSGQIQIVQIRINKDGEEQDAWVNLVTE